MSEKYLGYKIKDVNSGNVSKALYPSEAICQQAINELLDNEEYSQLNLIVCGPYYD